MSGWRALVTTVALGLTGCGLLVGIDYDDAQLRPAADAATQAPRVDGACVARSECAADQCGLVDDGCGGVLRCGGCGDGVECVAGRCRCMPQGCMDANYECSVFQGRCASIDCGSCTGFGEICKEERIGEVAQSRCDCAELQCPSGGTTCGTAPGGCDRVLVCGSVCPDGEDENGAPIPHVCGGGGGPNLCGPAPCQPVTACEADECGVKSNGCDDVINCGECETGTCGGGGVANRCGCKPTTCQFEGRECGTIDDGCGQALDCGSCAAPLECDPRGHCRCEPRPKAEACADRRCGFASDGCMSYHECGPPCE